jgi:hypothetical protein
VISKTIAFDGYDGKRHTREYFFHLNKAELTEMGLSRTEGMDVYIKRVIAAEDTAALFATLKEFLIKAVGVPSSDGVRFAKTSPSGEELWLEFIESEAYSELFIELVKDPTQMAQFLLGILPKDMQDEIKKNQDQLELPATGEAQPTPKIPTFDDYTLDQLREMPIEEFEILVMTAKGNVPQEILQLAMKRRFSDK